MAAVADTRDYPQAVKDEFARLAQECAICYQCGTCTSSCPSGRELYRGPRRIVRLILAGEIDAVLKSDDLWRCTECGTCTSVCRMDIDVAGILHSLRQLEREHGAIHCAERTAADVATTHLKKRPRIDNMRFGAAMVSKGYIPKDKVGAAEMGVKLARQVLPGGKKQVAEVAPAGAVALPFYAGCAIPQDHELHAVVHEVAAGFGVRLDEAADAGCCGHPSRGAVDSLFATAERVYTACPACDASLAESGVEAVPLWDALTERAGRSSAISLTAAGERFVPYVGCLADRDAALAALGDAAEQSGAADGRRLPDAAQRLLRRPGRHVPGRHQEQRAAPGVRRAAAGARRDDVRALPRQPPLGRARAQARRPRPLLARVLPGRPHRPRGAHR